jgi:hypothetical protein
LTYTINSIYGMSKPVSRDYMRSRKVVNDEKNRKQRITNIVDQIYTYAINLAGLGTQTEYHHFALDQFHRDNMDEIIERLQNLFEGCLVSYKNMYMGQDGKYYDLSTLNTTILPYDTKGKNRESIVIDWS